MAARRNYTLNDSQLEIITQAMKHDQRPIVRRRAQAIHLLHQGVGPRKVAEMVAAPRSSIYVWHDLWLKHGLDGLARKSGSGRKPKATPAYCQLLEEVLSHEPSDFGYDFSIWTIDRLREHMAKETNIEMSRRAFSDVLKREGFVYRRPKHDLGHLQDPEAVAKAKEQLDELKKRPKQVILNSSLWTKRRSP